jgi:hypothetical protein
MKTAFLTEMNFRGKIPPEHNNMRTEFAWMCALQADHYNIHDFAQLKDYDAIFIVFPKATVKLNACGGEMTTTGIDKDMSIYSKNVVATLKKSNKNVCNVQEGPSWFFNEYDMPTQFNFYNELAECDVLFAHNEYDTHLYKGLFPQTRVDVIPTLIIPTAFNINTAYEKNDKSIIGGNFAHWYGGFQSYITATEFDCPIFVPSSHCKRKGEEAVPNLTHLPWVMWNDWMKQLSSFKYAVNLMPTVAAGTFNLNCAFFGIPCIGNEKVDTQINLFPELSVDVNDVHNARFLARQLKDDKEFYEHVGHYAKSKMISSSYYNIDQWLSHIEGVING